MDYGLKTLFREAEIAKLNREDMNAYEQSLKIYRDNKNAMDYMKKEGREEGKREALLAVAKGMKEQGIDVNTILKITGLTKEQIDQL